MKIPKKSKNFSEMKKNVLHLSIFAKHPEIGNVNKNPEKNNIAFYLPQYCFFIPEAEW